MLPPVTMMTSAQTGGKVHRLCSTWRPKKIHRRAIPLFPYALPIRSTASRSKSSRIPSTRTRSPSRRRALRSASRRQIPPSSTSSTRPPPCSSSRPISSWRVPNGIDRRSAAVPAPVARPPQDRAAPHHGARDIATAGRNAPCRGAATPGASLGCAYHCWCGDEYVPFGPNATRRA